MILCEYKEDVFDHLLQVERRLRPKPRNRSHLAPGMRTRLVEWMIQVHQSFDLYPETLFLSVNYLDRFLGCRNVPSERLQLLGVTAILIASKYEEVEPLSLDQIVFITANSYDSDTIIRAERVVLSTLDFELGWPGPLIFLHKINGTDNGRNTVLITAQYLLEVALIRESFVDALPSQVAAAAYMLARLFLGAGQWVGRRKYHLL